jgi:YVTN family beta-propeller protein
MGRLGLALVLVSALMLSNAAGAIAAPFAYIPNSGSSNVSVIDTATNTVTATVGVGTSPAGAA